MDEFLTAIALVFVIEGVLPFCSPSSLRKASLLIAGIDEGKLRFAGFLSMLFGLFLLYLVR